MAFCIVGNKLRSLALLVAVSCLVLLGEGCSAERVERPDLISGKQQFVGKCGACHTLARANTKGTVGPNLDEAFRRSLADGLGRSAIRSVVEGQVENPNPRGAMPKGLASGRVLNDIASYIAQSVDKQGSDSGLLATAVQPAGTGKPATEKAGKLQIDADSSGQLSYVTNKASATSGAVTITMANSSGVGHNIAIQSGTNGPVLGASKIVSKGSASVTVNLKPGNYTFFCQVPGHRQAGMLGTLTVK